MVDVGASPAPAAIRRERAAVGLGNRVEVAAADAAALRAYDAFCRGAVHGPCQHPVWVRAWIEATGADAVIVTLEEDGRPAMKLALEVVAKGPLRIARFVGGNHANGNFAAVAGSMAADAAALRAALTAALRAARPDIDLVFLSRQNPRFGGRDNPLGGLATMGSPNVSLAVDLAGGFEAVLERHNPARKRKKLKYQLNRFKQAGGYRLVQAATPQEVERLLGTFFALKGASLRSKGIADSFAGEDIRAFFRALFRDALAEDKPPFVLRAVEVGGELAAINGLSVTSESVVCEFCTYSQSDPKSSPGYFLDHSDIEWTCGLGKAIYDLSVGDEDYKRSWCDVETWQFETLLPLGARGAALSLYERARAQAVRGLKSNQAAWALAKRLRARLGGGGAH